jgi:hypothetical protein
MATTFGTTSTVTVADLLPGAFNITHMANTNAG